MILTVWGKRKSRKPSVSPVILLLDTPLLLWTAGRPDKLSGEARSMIADPRNELWFSAASLWEITIKLGLGRHDFWVGPLLLRRGLVDNGYRQIGITGNHAMTTTHLPPIHEDPFDRVLVARAEWEGALFLTSDEVVAQYPDPILRV